MGYQWKLKKGERERLLREKQKAELVGSQNTLFTRAPAQYAVTFTCHLRKQAFVSPTLGLDGLLIVDNGRIVFWRQGTLGHISEEDAEEVFAILAKLPGEAPACLAEIVSDPDDFNTCQIQLRHGN